MKNLSTSPPKDGFQLSLSVFYATNFLTIGCYLPYFPIWLKFNELSGEEIGLILGAPMIVRVLFTPVFSLWADYLGDYRKILIQLSFFTFISFCLLQWASGFWGLLLIVVLGSLFWTSILPLTETIAMIGARQGKIHYGRARAVGSASFIVASVGAGVIIDYLGASIIAPLIMLTTLLTIISAINLPYSQGTGRLRAEVGQGKFSLEAVRQLMKGKLIWLFLIGAGLGQGCHAFYYGFATVHWQTIGYSGTLVGSLWALGVIAEIILFVFLGDFLRRYNAVYLILIGAGASLLRFAFMAFDPPLFILVPLQALHALSFGIAHLGAIYFIAASIPKALSATAQGLYASMSAGLFMGVMVFASGPLYETIGPFGYLVMASVALLALLFSLLLLLKWDGRLLIRS